MALQIGLTYDLRSDYLALGYSPEETAEFDKEETIISIERALAALGYTTSRIGHARELIRRLEAGERWDIVFNICEGLHGIGREAQVPAILDLYQVPYVFSDPLVLALTLHKGVAKRVVRDAGLPTSDFIVYHEPHDLDKLDFEAPYFVKPVAEGTGKGCSAKSIVRQRSALGGVCQGLMEQFRQPVLVESYLSGREFTVGITGSGRQAALLGSMEIVLNAQATDGGYSYENKANYEERVVYRQCDCSSDVVAAAAEELALAAWRILGCRDGGRVDIRCNGAGEPQFLEVNPLAGLNEIDSDLPILARMAGVSYQQLIELIMVSAIKRLQG